MAVPNFIYDGTMAFGTDVLTINSVAYIPNNLSITPQWAEAESFGATGLPARKRWTKGRYKLTAELQLATSGTAFPPPGNTFTIQIPNETSVTTFVVLATPYNTTNAPTDTRVVPLEAESAIGTITTA